jgi:cobalt/nickel transport system permease protein
LNFHAKAAALGRLESLAQGDSPLHALHPGAKIIAALVYIVTVLSFPVTGMSGMVPFVFYPVILAALGGVPWGLLLSRFLLSLPFVLLGAAANLLMLRETVFSIGPLPVTAGMISFLSILLRAFLAVSAALLLVAAIPFPEFIAQLGRMGLPRVFGMQIALTWRYVSVLFAEAAAMYTAYLLRSRVSRGIFCSVSMML